MCLKSTVQNRNGEVNLSARIGLHYSAVVMLCWCNGAAGIKLHMPHLVL